MILWGPGIKVRGMRPPVPPPMMSGQVLSIHWVVSTSWTVRPCSPWGGRWIGHWRTTWRAVCSSAPHSQAAEEAIPHLYKQERKRPTPVRRRLSRTQAVSGAARNFVPGGLITWCTFDCSFRLFPNNWKLMWSTSEKLSKFVSLEGTWALRPHSGRAAEQQRNISLFSPRPILHSALNICRRGGGVCDNHQHQKQLDNLFCCKASTLSSEVDRKKRMTSNPGLKWKPALVM